MKKKRIKILVVDDNEDVAEVIKTHLNWRGFDSVEILTNPTLAANKVKNEGFEIVLSDIKMPEMDGIELLKLIKETRGETLVIMTTGHSTAENVGECQKYGALDFVFKPFGSFAELDTVMDRAIEILTRWQGIMDKVSDVDIF